MEDEGDSDVFMFICDNDLDNIAITKGFISETGEEVAFSISQSRSAGKKVGQDTIAALSRGRYECCVICDGHDLHGEIVSRAVCKTLSQLVIENLLDLPASVDISSPEAEGAILEAFQECERLTMWTNESIQPNSFVKITSGEFEGMVGYVSDVHYEDGACSVIVIDAKSFHKPRLQKNQLECAKYIGGCTCVVYIRDAMKNIARVAYMGDTRVLLVNGKKSGLENDTIFEEITPGAFLSYPHDVFNTAELHRIQTDVDPKDYEIDGPYLINPFTGCEIQPTRGFGDFDMYGSGFINVPDISVPFALTKGSLLLIASDGIFDDQVWDFTELVKFIENRLDPKYFKDLETLAGEVHEETILKSLAGGYVDDISIFACCVTPPKSEEATAIAATAAAAAGSSSSFSRAPTTTNSVSFAHTSTVAANTTSSSTLISSGRLSMAKDARAISVSSTTTSKYQPRGSSVYTGKDGGNGSNLSKFGTSLSVGGRLSTVSNNGQTSTSRQSGVLLPRSPTSSIATAPPRKGSAMPILARSVATSQDSVARGGRRSTAAASAKGARSHTHDVVSMKRKSTFSSMYKSARDIRAQTADTSKPRYQTGQKQTAMKKLPRGSIVETVRRTYGPSFTLPDGVEAASVSTKLGAEAAKIVAQNAVDDLSKFSAKDTTTRTTSTSASGRVVSSSYAAVASTGAAANSSSRKKSSMFDVKSFSPYHANAVLQRIALRFGHDLAALEQLMKDIDLV